LENNILEQVEEYPKLGINIHFTVSRVFMHFMALMSILILIGIKTEAT
jgi:hypothetical protein